MWSCRKAEKPTWPGLELLQAQIVFYRFPPALITGGL
jgi:hypothetical protein